MENGQSCSLPLPSPMTISPSLNPAGYFTAPHHLTSYYLIRPPYFWHGRCKTTRLLYVRSWQRPRGALRAALWHVASAGMAVQSSLDEDHAAAVWMPGGELAGFERLSAKRASSWEMRLWPGTRELALQRLHACVAQNQSWETISICFQPLD